MPENVTVWPLRLPVRSPYMFASMVLFPTEPAPPEGVSQNGLGSFTVFGLSLSTGPVNTAVRSGVPQELPKTNAPPCCGISNTFMNAIQLSPGLTVMLVLADAVDTDRARTAAPARDARPLHNVARISLPPEKMMSFQRTASRTRSTSAGRYSRLTRSVT